MKLILRNVDSVVVFFLSVIATDRVLHNSTYISTISIYVLPAPLGFDLQHNS